MTSQTAAVPTEPASVGLDGALRRVGKETLPQFLKRAALSIAFDLKPPRTKWAPTLFYRTFRHLLASPDVRNRLPDPADALPGREAIAGFCDDLSVETMIRGYALGLFPCTHFGPMRWYSPKTRSVLELRDFKLRDELKRKLKKKLFRVTFDMAPEAVIRACAEPRPGQVPITWLGEDMIQSFLALNQHGTVHSLEVWDETGALIGGLFGTIAGKSFIVESLFHTRDNTSKYGLAVLMGHLQAWGFTHVDYKLHNPHVAALGFLEIPREDLCQIMTQETPAIAAERIWRIDETLDLGRWKPSDGAPPRVAR